MIRLAASEHMPPNSGPLRDQPNLSLAQTIGRVESTSDKDYVLFGVHANPTEAKKARS
jgi:hypothetical protein